MRWTLSLVAVVGSLAAAPAVADGRAETERYWPQWRGPRATGVAPRGNPPVEWDESRNVRWKTEIPGRGVSTPIVWGDLVFVTTAVEAGERADPEAARRAEEELPEWRRQAGVAPTHVLRFTVLALDRRTGEIRWRRVLREAAPREGTHADGSWASNSPVTDGKHLIVHFGSNGTYGLNLQGDLIWERDLGQMKTRRGFGEGSSPVLHGERVIINWDHEGPSFIIALDKNTGETVWKADRDEVTSWSTPLIVDRDGEPQIIVSATGRTRGYDPSTGQVIWEAGGMTMNAIPSPVSGGGRVYVTSGFRGHALQAIDLDAARGDITGSAAIAWQHDQDTPYVPSPLLYGDRLYFLKRNSGILSCYDATTGKPHYGPQRLEAIEGIYASPVGAGGRVYIAGRDGTTIVLDDGETFKVLAENSLDEGFSASPAVAGDELYLRGQKHLYCIAGGKKRAATSGGRAAASPE